MLMADRCFNMGSRRKARELALQMLFQWEVGHHTAEHVVSTFLASKKLDADVESFARGLFEGTVKDVEALDHALRERAEHWRPERMAAVDRNVIRLALYELLHHPQTPSAVVINEAIEIARRFSGKDSVEFVNGVLDGIRKTLPVERPKT
ncbi:MAG TPA: transcription antitermination factor NusB [Candidatus Binatia bacterium]|nr:transcription antitermination factor NusB [Candidatus Binatia bacterium]